MLSMNEAVPGGVMKFRSFLLTALVLNLAVATPADKKNKKVLPEYVLRAQTVCVVIQANVREPMSDPNANLKAQKDVENAVLKWGRFQLALDVETADLVIAVQKGTGKTAAPTIGGGPTDTRPVILDGSDSSIRIGGHQGTPPATTQDPGQDTRRPSEGAQIGGTSDVMKVYQGGVEYPLDQAPIWNYSGKDALKAPDVKAVEEFRKAVAEAEKAAQQKQQQKQNGQGTQQGSGNSKP